MKKVLFIWCVSMVLMMAGESIGMAKNGENYFSDDFENQTGWESLAYSGWGSSNGGSVGIRDDGKTDNGKCAVVNAYWGSSLDAAMVPALAGNVGISFDMMMDKRSVDGMYLINSDGSMSTQWLLKFEWKNGTYGMYALGADPWNTAPLYTLQQDEWVNIKMILDTENNKYSVWITSESGQTKNIIYNAPAPFGDGFNGVTFFYAPYGQYGVLETDIGDFKLDNFNLYAEIPEENENFDSFEETNRIGNVNGWSSSNDGGAVSIVSEDNNKYMQINSLWENSISKIFTAKCNDNTVFELKIKAEQPKGEFIRLLTDKIEDSFKSENILCLTQDADGKNQLIYCYGEGVWNILPGEYENNSWIKLTVIINRNEGKWYGYLNQNPNDDGVGQLIFKDSIATLSNINGLQIYYPMHYADESSVGKNFCIDDFHMIAFALENSYDINAVLTTTGGTTIASKTELLDAKDNNPLLNMTLCRETYGEMDSVYGLCALYQDGKMISCSLDKNFALEGIEKEKTIPIDLDFSKLSTESSDVAIKVFLWSENELSPFANAYSVFEK